MVSGNWYGLRKGEGNNQLHDVPLKLLVNTSCNHLKGYTWPTIWDILMQPILRVNFALPSNITYL
ncbi:uncharacterized protein G2W53_013132 [Senna tora]|uniref:Uncharacterized protein n=1 Tax=Senna tora TaxID=362788 RepID=A0A834TZA0_9FABA|nr:uncharacterized protein G2W53_013132 [Senna tora]